MVSRRKRQRPRPHPPPLAATSFYTRTTRQRPTNKWAPPPKKKDGRWLLEIAIPPSYPLAPPSIRFATPVVHANVALRTGEICLDLLASAWTPAYTVLECVRAVRALLACPEADSPLNVDVAALLRAGDAVAARGLVAFWIADGGGRYEGE